LQELASPEKNDVRDTKLRTSAAPRANNFEPEWRD
jgi:hypothetical protein